METSLQLATELTVQ